MIELDEMQLKAIREWAELEFDIKAVHLFGSKVTGTSYADSDADLALVLTVPDEQANGLFFMCGQFWQQNLRERTGLKVNIAYLAGELTPIHTSAVAEHGIRLWPAVV